MAWWAALGKVAGSLGGGGKQGGGGLGGLVKGVQGASQNLTGATIGAGQMILGAIQKRKADAMLPSGVSAAERNLLLETQRMRKAAQTNMPFAQSSSAARDTKMAMDRAFRMGGRNIGALSANLENAKTGIAAQAAQQAAGLLGQEMEGQKYAGSVVRDVQMLRSARKSADAAGNLKAGMSNILTAISPKSTSGELRPVKTDASGMSETTKRFKKKASETMGQFGNNPFRGNNGLTGPASNGLTNIGL